MRAIRIAESGGPEVLRLAEVDLPEPAAGQVRVRVRAAGVNRADLLQRQGRYPAPAGVPADIPGLEYAGVVDAVGADVRGATVGDRVMGILGGGGYAEAVVADAPHLMPVPAGWSFEEAAAVPEAFLTAHDALVQQAELAAGERLLIHAVASSVGLALLQVGRAQGAEVAGTSRSAWKLERAATLGLEHPVLVQGTFAPGAELADWAHVIADLVGGPYLAGDLEAAAPRARLLVIGLTGGRRATVDLGVLLQKRIRLVGTVLRSRSTRQKTDVVRRFAQWATPHLEGGRLRPVLDRVFPMAAAAEAHRYLEDNRNVGSVVLTWD